MPLELKVRLNKVPHRLPYIGIGLHLDVIGVKILVKVRCCHRAGSENNRRLMIEVGPDRAGIEDTPLHLGEVGRCLSASWLSQTLTGDAADGVDGSQKNRYLEETGE